MSTVERRPRGPLITDARPVYTASRLYLTAYMRLWHRLKVEGFEHLPQTGGVMVVSNHQSFLDIPVLAVACRRHVAFVARDTLNSFGPLAWLMRRAGSVLVRQNTADRSALEEMIAHLEQGDCVAVFPEGTRTEDGSVGPFLPGAAFAARRANAPLVPVAISGAFEALPRGRLVASPRRVRVRFAAPVPSAPRDALETARGTIERMMEDWRAVAR